MNNFWDKRYNTSEYVYGEAPNKYFKQELIKLKPGKILLPAEGEGRNAVFAASIGWNVTAFDISSEAKRKARILAEKKGVNLDYQITQFEDAEFELNYFDCICLTFAHLPSAARRNIHRKLCSFLKPGGFLILQAFSKEQINKNTGGPPNIDMLYSEVELKEDFKEFSKLSIVETELKLDEGPFHQGLASVIQVIGKK